MNPRDRYLDALGWLAAASDEIEEVENDLPETMDFEALRYGIEITLSRGLTIAEQLAGDDR